MRGELHQKAHIKQVSLGFSPISIEPEGDDLRKVDLWVLGLAMQPNSKVHPSTCAAVASGNPLAMCDYVVHRVSESTGCSLNHRVFISGFQNSIKSWAKQFKILHVESTEKKCHFDSITLKKPSIRISCHPRCFARSQKAINDFMGKVHTLLHLLGTTVGVNPVLDTALVFKFTHMLQDAKFFLWCTVVSHWDKGWRDIKGEW